MKKVLSKNIVWNIIGITVNAIYSIVLVIFITRYQNGGLALAGQFSYAFYIGSLLSTIGNYGGRIYYVTDNQNKYKACDYVSLKYFTSFIMIVIGLLFCFVNNYALEKTLLILFLTLFRLFESVSDAYYGIMQKNNNLYSVGISMTFKAVCSTILFIVLMILTNSILLSSVSFCLVFLIITYLYDRRVCLKYEEDKIIISKKTMDLLKKCFSIFVFAFFTLLMMNIVRYFVDMRLTDVDQGYFNILILPASIIVLFAQFLIQPILKKLTDMFHEKKYKEFKKLNLKIIGYFVSGGLLLSIISYFIGTQILGILYNVDLSNYKLLLFYMIFAGVCNGATAIISAIMTIKRKMNEQILMVLISSILAIVISIFYIKSIETATIVYMVSMLIQLILFIFVYIKESRKLNEKS